MDLKSQGNIRSRQRHYENDGRGVWVWVCVWGGGG